MSHSSSLPWTLLALSLVGLSAVLPVLAAAASLPPTSYNDPFRAIVAVRRARQPEPPLCCLKPPPTIDPPEGPEGVLLSFEEWKSKQLHPPLDIHNPTKLKTDTTPDGATSPPSGQTKTNANANANDQHADVPAVDVPAAVPPDPSTHPYPYSPGDDDTLPPHFRVPIVDRFNYANLDCSARVHTAHGSAKSASSILSDKKDKYMLSPCGAAGQFVVVELCDDIRIDTVQLANFEFFSGVFKEFSVSVAKTYTGTEEGWTPAGTYRAKNVRGVQSFHLPTFLRDFYRYIRIDFHSHYGHEYYCPVSLLRVYGLTHLEEWKWDTWQAESRARLRDSASQRSLTTSDVGVPKDSSNVSATARDAVPEIRSQLTSPPSLEPAGTPSRETSSSAYAQVAGEGSSAIDRDGRQQILVTQSTGLRSVAEAISSLSSSPTSVVSNLPTTEPFHTHAHDSGTNISTMLPSPSSLTPPLVQHTTHAAPPQQWSGESIYRTIMNRLTTLETNHTLYARYLEEQIAGVREVLRKLTEEVGRLESVSRMQAQMYQRTVHEWERQRLRLELEHGELLSRVNHLSDEVVLEKQLGIAQLCLLLAVLVFIGLTRGAPSAQHPPLAAHRSAREWSVHNFSFGGSADSWNLLRRRSRSPTEQNGNMGAKAEEAIENRLLFLGSTGSPRPRSESRIHAHPHAVKALKLPALSSMTTTATASSHKRAHTHTASTYRTPTKPRPLAPIELHTLPRVEPISRSHSSSTSSHFQARSAKRWARSAHVHHLHEIKAMRERRGSTSVSRSGGTYKDRENRREDSLGDVSGVGGVSGSMSASSPLHVQTRWKLHDDRLRRHLAGSLEGSTDGDMWIDTDVEVDDDVSVVESERAVVLNSPPADRDVFS